MKNNHRFVGFNTEWCRVCNQDYQHEIHKPFTLIFCETCNQFLSNQPREAGEKLQRWVKCPTNCQRIRDSVHYEPNDDIDGAEARGEY